MTWIPITQQVETSCSSPLDVHLKVFPRVVSHYLSDHIWFGVNTTYSILQVHSGGSILFKQLSIKCMLHTVCHDVMVETHEIFLDSKQVLRLFHDMQYKRRLSLQILSKFTLWSSTQNNYIATIIDRQAHHDVPSSSSSFISVLVLYHVT